MVPRRMLNDGSGLGPVVGEMAPNAYAFGSFILCWREDLNLHGLAATGT